MSEKVGDLGEDIQNLRQRVERLEALLGRDRRLRLEKPEVEDLMLWQQNIPHLKDYDVWSIVLVKKQGASDFRIGHYGSGADYVKLIDLSLEDAANLAGALSHPARILVLRECQGAAQYASDLEARVSAKYGALYHHLNSLVEANLLVQEKERGKYIATSAGKTALLFLNILASVIASIEAQAEKPKTVSETMA